MLRSEGLKLRDINKKPDASTRFFIYGAKGVRTLKFPSTLRLVLLVLERRRLVPAPDVNLTHETIDIVCFAETI